MATTSRMPDVVRFSNLFGAPLRTPPKEAETISHKLLAQGGFIHQLAAGIFSLLPLGFRVHERIGGIIREEMRALGAQEVLLPSLHPKALWEKTGRWKDIDPPLFTLKDRHDREYALAPTHEEVVTDLARTVLHSYKQLPVAVFQIQTKFRNEQRPTGGLLRTREFVMKDLYSFHATEEDLEAFYERVKGAYLRVFRRCGLETVPVAAESGSIGGSVSHEFALLAETGEDRVAQCPSCGFGAKLETLGGAAATPAEAFVKAGGKRLKCPQCSRDLEIKNCIESGHVFQLGQKYSATMNATFTTEKGSQEVFVMGCYGIGVGRVLAAIVEASHDEKGVVWPSAVAPFDVHLLSLAKADRQGADVQAMAEDVVPMLVSAGRSVLYDDREDASPGEKFADADLIGIPWRVVVSEKHKKTGTVGLKRRTEKEEQMVKLSELETALRE